MSVSAGMNLKSEMAKKDENGGSGPKMGPKKDGENTNDSWSGATGSESIADLSEDADDRLLQMRHGDESAKLERTTDEPASADFSNRSTSSRERTQGGMKGNDGR